MTCPLELTTPALVLQALLHRPPGRLRLLPDLSHVQATRDKFFKTLKCELFITQLTTCLLRFQDKYTFFADTIILECQQASDINRAI